MGRKLTTVSGSVPTNRPAEFLALATCHSLNLN